MSILPVSTILTARVRAGDRPDAAARPAIDEAAPGHAATFAEALEAAHEHVRTEPAIGRRHRAAAARHGRLAQKSRPADTADTERRTRAGARRRADEAQAASAPMTPDASHDGPRLDPDAEHATPAGAATAATPATPATPATIGRGAGAVSTDAMTPATPATPASAAKGIDAGRAADAASRTVEGVAPADELAAASIARARSARAEGAATEPAAKAATAPTAQTPTLQAPIGMSESSTTAPDIADRRPEGAPLAGSAAVVAAALADQATEGSAAPVPIEPRETDPDRVTRPRDAATTAAASRADGRGAPATGTGTGAALVGTRAGGQAATGGNGQSGLAGNAERDSGRADQAGGPVTQAIGRSSGRRTGAEHVAPTEVADQTTARVADGAGANREAIHRTERAGDAVATASIDRPAADAADRVLGQVIDRMRAFSTDGTPGLETRFEDPQLGTLRLIVSGRAGDTVQAEIVAVDARSAEAIGRAIERAATTSAALHGITLQVRTADTAGSGANGHLGDRRHGDSRDEAARPYDGRGDPATGDPGRGGRDREPAFVGRPAVDPIGAIRRRPSTRPTPIDVIGRPTGRPGVDVRA
jgi:hypothetical protein